MRRRPFIALTATAALAAFGLTAATPASATPTTLNVTTTADTSATSPTCSGGTTTPSPLSLRDAVCLANNLGGTVVIKIPAGDYLLANGELDAGLKSGQNVTLQGTDAATTTIDAQSKSRVLNFDENLLGGISATVSGLTITGGADSTFGGAGIIGGSGNSTSGDSLDIESSVITGNAANAATPTATNNFGGGVQFIGGALTVNNSTISNNSSLSSGGSGVYYQAQGKASGESLTVSGDTFSGNQVANSTGSSVPTDGTLEIAAPAAMSSLSVSDSTFSANVATDTNGPVRGAGITVEGGTVSIEGDDFTGNSITGSGSSGAAVAVAAGTVTAEDNRIVGNHVSAAATATGIATVGGTVTAIDNWWGCNGGPGTTGCDTIGGSSTVNPWLVLSGAPVTVTEPASATVSADVRHDSNGAAVAATEPGLNGDADSFSDPEPAGATCTGAPTSFSGGTASTSCTYAPNGVSGAGHVVVTVDNQSVTIPVTVDESPAIVTNPGSLSVAAGNTASFTAAASGYPTPTVQWQVSTDGGATFANIAGATSNPLTFTATAAQSGDRYRAVFTNSVASATTSAATLTVEQAPGFTSGATANFTVGTSGSFGITTSGLPKVTQITESGPLPSGLTFTDNGDGTATISGTPAAGTGGTYPIQLDASNGVTPDATQTLDVVVSAPPVVGTNPSDATVAPGTTVSFSASATGYPTPTVQWQVSTDGGATFANIAGATSSPLSFTASTAQSGNRYRAVFTNSVASATTTAATLTVQQAPTFTSTNATTLTAGTAGTFTVTTSGVPNPTLSESGALPSGVTFTDNGNGTATLAGTPAVGTGGTYAITLTATNGITPDGSQSFTLTVDEAPHFSSAATATFQSGVTSSFVVTTDRGFPTPALLVGPTLPAGLTFTDNGNGTATITGSTTSVGDNSVAITAQNTAGSVQQSLTIVVTQPPSITSAPSTTFIAGTAGSFTVTTAGFPKAAVSQSGALPSGVTFTDNGDGTATLGGTPAAGTGGTYPITFTAHNGIGSDATQSFTLIVDQAPAVTSAGSTTFTVGAAGTFTVTTTGVPNAALSETGALPGGVTFTDNGDGTATLVGTPAAATGGTYPITITAANGVTPAATQSFTLTVDQAPAITSAGSTTFTAGAAGTFTVTSTGHPTAALSESGTLPSGVTFTDNGDGTATLAGTPAAGTGGTYPITITASNGVTPDGSQSFTLTVDQAASITSTASATFTAGTAGTFTVTTTGVPIAALSESGALPSGVTFTDNGDGTATLAGTPAAGTGGTYPLTLTAHNGIGSDAAQSFTLTVDQSPAITSAAATTFTAGAAGTFTVTTSGIPDPALSETGALPSGVTFTDNGNGTATLAGTPAAGTGGSYPLTISAHNGVTPDAAQSFTLTVDQSPAITSGASVTFGAAVAATPFTVTTSGFPKSALSESGALPSGVTFTDNGDGTATLAGTPAAGTAGSYPLTITAANGVTPDATQSFTLTVSVAPQTITFTSTPPISPVVGQTYPVAATGGASGNPVTFTIDATATGFCSISGSTVTFTHPGSCVVDAHQDGNGQYAAAAASQTIAVTKAATTTAVAVTAHAITATVTAVAPGAGTPTGVVTFAVDGNPVGTANLSAGVATLTYTVPTGSTQHVAVSYGGDGDFTGSSASTARQDPLLTATVSSSVARSRYGWYRVPVTVTFHCTPEGAALTAPCPAPVTFVHNGAGQSVTRTIMATDGGAATVTVRGLNIDRTPPTVSIAGVSNGAAYPGVAPKARCVAHDALSGVASCTLTSHTSGLNVTVTATATDKAGNVRTAQVTYHVLRIFILGAPLSNGTYTVAEGQTYTVVVLTPSTSAPRYYDAVPLGQAPRPPDNYFRPGGTQYGLHRYTLAVRIDRGLGRYYYWVFGVKIGSVLNLVRFHPTH